MIERISTFLAGKYTLAIITLIFIVSFILLSSLVYKYTNDYALNEAKKRIESMLMEHRAKHGYIEEIQKPVIYGKHRCQTYTGCCRNPA